MARKKEHEFKAGEFYQYRDDGPAFKVVSVKEGVGVLKATTSITGYVLTTTTSHPDVDGWVGPLREDDVKRIEASQHRKAGAYEQKMLDEQRKAMAARMAS